jgi:hypothetical protein
VNGLREVRVSVGPGVVALEFDNGDQVLEVVLAVDVAEEFVALVDAAVVAACRAGRVRVS